MRIVGPFLARALSAVVVAVCVAASAAAQTPTTEQLEIFRNLTPEQQEAVLDQMGQQSAGRQDNAPTDREKSGDEQRQQQTDGVEEQRRRATVREEDEPKIPVLAADDTIVIELRMPRINAPETGTDRRRKLEETITLVGTRNPYQLDRDAQLNLPGFVPIALGGLTEEQARQRLSLEPALLPLEVKLTRLPLAKTGIAGLKPYGYDLFDSAPSSFSPVTDLPVPADYVIGAGDELNVQLFGNQNRNLRLIVNRDGSISFPELGPLRVGGLTFNAARRLVEARVAEQMIGVTASVSMGETRSIRVFVLGEARYPGSYAVSGLATVTTAMFAAGGVKPIGSLRDVQLKRLGTVVRRFDLYDMLIRGDTSDDAKLLPGDVIFIPPVGPTISIDGEVKRPAIYELRNETSLAAVVGLAGGFTSEADTGRASLTRIDADSRRVVLDVNLRQAGGDQGVRNGDVLRVSRLRPQLDSGVVLEGFVHRPGSFAWREGLRLSNVIGSVDELKPGADQHYILIRRETGAERRLAVISADLTAALAAPGSAADVALAPRDRIVVFDLAPGRERIIQPLVEELKLQADLARPTELVRIGGRVKAPGEYPLEPGMRVSDLLRAGGNLDAAAYGGTAELTRYTIGEAGARQTELVEIDLAAVRRGDAGANLPLMPFDYLAVKETPDWTDQEFVTLRGEVRFPGTYPIRKGETLREVLARAGGLTVMAFPEGGVFTRMDLKVLEQQQIDRLAERMRSDLASLALAAANAGQSDAAQALQSGQALLAQLQGAKATGRFVIDLPGLLISSTRSEKDVVMRDGDELFIPKKRQEVTVIGEVQNASSHLYLPKLRRVDYISLSGGTTKKADRGRVYVVHADGSVASRRGSWLARNYDAAIKPGDSIVVPLDTERMPRLPLWQAVTQILYNVAVSVAAVNSF
jgi:protein involved in polysaccharide export with SLBB domain